MDTTEMPWSAVTKTIFILLLLSPPLLREPLFLRVLLTFNIYSFAEAALRGVGCFYLKIEPPALLNLPP